MFLNGIRMIRALHTADIHFGVENYGIIDHATGLHSRLLDFKMAFDVCIDYAINESVDLFIFAGDAYKNSHPTPTHQKLFLESLMRLYRAKIPVVIVVGNHDHPGNTAKAHALDVFYHLPVDGFYVISKPESLKILTKNGMVQVVGIPWPTRSTLQLSKMYFDKQYLETSDIISDALRSAIAKYAQELDPEIPAFLVGHLTVSTGLFSGSERQALTGKDPVLHPSDLALKPFDYVALGHLHRHQNLNKSGYPAVVYSGSPERIDFGEVHDIKGFCLVTIPEKNQCFYEFIPLPVRSFLQIDIALKASIDLTEQIIREIEKYDLKGSVVKIRYTLPPETKDTMFSNKVYTACKDAWYLAGLHCTNPYKVREQRMILPPKLSLEDSLRDYCLQHQNYKHNTDAYVELFREYVQKDIEQ